MAIDLNAIRNRLNSLQTKVQKTDTLWKPNPGKQQIRLVPYVHNKENPFIELYFHFDFGGKTILSPISFGEKDPIVEFSEQLKATKDREDYNLSKKLTPKMRTYVPILVRGEESEGVKFWGFGKQVYQEILAFFADPDYGDLTDPMSGRDITVEFKSAAEVGKSYPETFIRVKPNTTPMTEDKNIVQLVKSQADLTTIFKRHTYDELKAMLEVWLETGEVKEEAKAEQPAVVEATPTTTKAGSVKEAFDDLFND